MINPFLAEKLPEVQRLFKEHQIKRAYAFGSVVTDKFSVNSDIDFLVTFEYDPDPLVRGERWWNLYFKLQDLLDRNVDLLTEDQIKNPYLIESINSNKVLIYGN